MAKDKILEVCVDSYESAVIAKENGADRLELCADLLVGGTTANMSLFRKVRRELGLPVHVLVRPRPGDFLYTDAEIDVMLDDIEVFSWMDVRGVVCGCLNADGTLDEKHLEALVKMAHENKCAFTLNRAFDLCREPFEALRCCRELGVDFILTSGQAKDCVSGIPFLQKLFEEAGDTQILLGGGIDGDAILRLRRELPRACQFHMSGKTQVESGMEYRKAGVNMGLPGFDEFQLWRADPEKIREAKEALESEIF